MISTRFCPVCGAANDGTLTHCFACAGILPSMDETGAGQATLLHERYRLGPTVGSGGYSAVFRGWDIQQAEREVAIKQINLRGLNAEETIEATNTYNREIEALASLQHPQIPRLYDHFADPEHWYLVLEYIKGQTLEAFLNSREAQGKPLKLAEILAVGQQLCTVLEYLHERQPPVIFRDLKPGNIMRTPEGTLYLIDFGIARRYTPGQSRDTQSLGSPGYAAPEQYGRAQTDAHADIYSLGALLRFLLTGHDPSEELPALVASRLSGQPGNAELEKLLARMLAAHPDDRPRSAFHVSRELEHIRQLDLATQHTKSIWQPPTPQDYTPATASAALASAQIYLQNAQASVSSNTPQTRRGQRKILTRRNVLLGLGAGAVAATVGIGLGIKNTATPTPGPGQLVYTYRGHSSPVYSASWSLDNQYLASASRDGSAQLWGALKGSRVSTYANVNGAINSIACTFGNTYAIGCADTSLNILNANGVSLLNEQQKGPVNSVAWSSDGVYLAWTDIAVHVLDFQGNSGTSLGFVDKNMSQGYTALAWSHDYGIIFASASNTNTITSWQINDLNPIQMTYNGPTETITCIACSPNGALLAAGSQDAEIVLWDIASGNISMTLSVPNSQIRALAWSPDGQHLASASDDGVVRVWSSKDGNISFDYTGHTGPVYTVAWSPNGQHLASAGEDTTVQVWLAP